MKKEISAIQEAEQDNRILKFLMTLTQIILNATIQVENDKYVSTEADISIMKMKIRDFFLPLMPKSLVTQPHYVPPVTFGSNKIERSE